MQLGKFRINNRLVSLVVLFVAHCGVGAAAEDVWNTTVEEATIQLVKDIRASVDRRSQPCGDFQGYICGRIEATNQTTSEEEVFQKFIESEDDEQFMDAELNVKRFFLSCKEARGLEQLKSSHLYRLTGGWPAIEGTNGTGGAASWVNVLAAFHDIGAEYFFKHRIEMRSNKRHVQLEMNKDFRYSLKKNTQLAEELLQSFGVSSPEARMIALNYAGIESFRRELAKTEDGSPATMTYADFNGKYSNIDWDAYFRRTAGKPLKDNDTLRLQDEQKLHSIFSMLGTTAGVRLQNYLWIDYLLEKPSASCVDLVREYFQPVYRHIVQRALINRRRTAKLFSEVGGVYQSLLLESVWIDEITNEKSKVYLGKMIHTALNGDTSLDAKYATLALTQKNFYRNLEKCQRFQTSGPRRLAPSSSASVIDLYEFFTGPMYNAHLPKALLYGSIGMPFAERMIGGGDDTSVPGNWRSSDSDEKYGQFLNCLRDQNVSVSSPKVMDSLVRRMLAQRQTFQALRNWMSGNVEAANRIRAALTPPSSGKMNLKKIFFYTSVRMQCSEGKEFINTYLRNSADFADAFSCPKGSAMRAAEVCSVL